MGNSCTDCFVVTMLASLLSNEAPRLGAQYHNTLPRPSNLLSATWHQPGEGRSGDYFPQCMRSPHDVITEKAPTSRAFSWMKAATTAFTFKTLLRHYAKRALAGIRRDGHLLFEVEMYLQKGCIMVSGVGSSQIVAGSRQL